MKPPRSLHDMRRLAPLHWQGRAENARHSAFTLWTMRDDDDWRRRALHLSGSSRGSLHEGFNREAALSLELILKALLAQEIETDEARAGVNEIPATHDLPRLWLKTGLDPLMGEDLYVLHRARQILVWAGRYPVPKSEDAYAQEHAAMEPHAPGKVIGELKVRSGVEFNWDRYDRLYARVNERMWQLREEFEKGRNLSL